MGAPPLLSVRRGHPPRRRPAVGRLFLPRKPFKPAASARDISNAERGEGRAPPLSLSCAPRSPDLKTPG